MRRAEIKKQLTTAWPNTNISGGENRLGLLILDKNPSTDNEVDKIVRDLAARIPIEKVWAVKHDGWNNWTTDPELFLQHSRVVNDIKKYYVNFKDLDVLNTAAVRAGLNPYTKFW